MRFRWMAVGWLLALTAIGALVFETWRLAELVGRTEVEKRALQQQLAAATPASVAQAAPPAQVPAPPREVAPGSTAPAAGAANAGAAAVDALAYAALQLELQTTKQQLAVVTATLEEQNQARERRRAAEQAAAQARQPMPEGVRACLVALQGWLRLEGFDGQRFLRAQSLEPDGLHGVEMLDAAADGLEVAFVQAGLMTATLDRALGRLELRFFDGVRVVGEMRTPLPKDGLPLVYRDVDGRRAEQMLPFLVQVLGSYPLDPVASRPSTDVDPITRRQWMERLEAVLDRAGMDLRWRPTKLVGMDGGWFLDVDLIGTDDKHHVVAAAHAGRLAIEVDRAAGVASLRLQNGGLRRDDVESTITAEGMRMLLPNLSPQKATDAMFGMVVTK